jgi:hypothetical protein
MDFPIWERCYYILSRAIAFSIIGVSLDYLAVRAELALVEIAKKMTPVYVFWQYISTAKTLTGVEGQ